MSKQRNRRSDRSRFGDPRRRAAARAEADNPARTPAWVPLTQLDGIPAHMRERWKRSDDHFDEIWRNGDYEVFVRYVEGERAGPLHLSIKRYDREPVTDWRHKQAIKNEIAGPLREAAELFPAESRLVDAANQTHLWVAPEGAVFDFGYEEYAAGDITRMRDVAAKLGHDPQMLQGARQRPWQPGISTGPDYARRNGWLPED